MDACLNNANGPMKFSLMSMYVLITPRLKQFISVFCVLVSSGEVAQFIMHGWNLVFINCVCMSVLLISLVFVNFTLGLNCID